MRKFYFLFIFVIGISAPMLVTKLFPITTIDCQLMTGESCPHAYEEKISEMIGKPLFSVSPNNGQEANAAAAMGFEVVDYRRKLPGTIILTVQSEDPQYLLVFKDTAVLISEFGMVLHRPVPDKILTIEIAENDLSADTLILNDKLIDPYVQALSAIARDLSTNTGVHVEKIIWHNEYEIELILDKYPSVLIEASKPSAALAQLRILLSSTELSDILDDVSTIDLRFDLPVLRTSQ